MNLLKEVYGDNTVPICYRKTFELTDVSDSDRTYGFALVNPSEFESKIKTNVESTSAFSSLDFTGILEYVGVTISTGGVVSVALKPNVENLSDEDGKYWVFGKEFYIRLREINSSKNSGSKSISDNDKCELRIVFYAKTPTTATIQFSRDDELILDVKDIPILSKKYGVSYSNIQDKYEFIQLNDMNNGSSPSGDDLVFKEIITRASTDRPIQKFTDSGISFATKYQQSS